MPQPACRSRREERLDRQLQLYGRWWSDHRVPGQREGVVPGGGTPL